MYVDFEQKDSTDPTKYAWSLIKGSDGLNGKDGIAGAKGEDGKTSYTHIAYANSATGEGFSQQPDGKTFIGMYVDFEVTDSTDVTKYNWSLVKGEDGSDGTPGKPGADGRTPYFHIAYADSADGKNGFYVGGGTNLMEGTTADFVTFSGTSWAVHNLGDYSGLIVGNQYTASASVGNADHNVAFEAYAIKADGTRVRSMGSVHMTPNSRNSFTFTWADLASSGAVGVRLDAAWTNDTDSGSYQVARIKLEQGSVATPWSPAPSESHPIYMGTYTDYTQADSLDPTKYAWSLIKGDDGKDGVAGKAGADGKTPYFHTAWADSKDGKINFSLTDSTNRGYLGNYTDFTQADSTDPAKYRWTELVGNLNLNGRNLAARKLFRPWGQASFQGDSSVITLTETTTELYSGLNIQRPSTFKNNTEYIMSFDFQILTGEITAIGGHMGDFSQTEYIKIDGVDKGVHWEGANAFAPSAGRFFHFEIGMKTLADYSNNNNAGGFFIQPNRGVTAHQYVAQIVNLRINEGNKDMGWQRPPEDIDDTIDSLQTPNLVYNAGFIGDYKVGLDGWVMEGSDKYYMTNATLYNGNHSGAINVKATGDQWWVLGSKPVAVSQGSKISYSGASFTGAGSVPTNLGAEIGCYDSSGKHFANAGGVGIPIKKGVWTTFKLENITLPAGTVKISFRYTTHVQPNNQINQYISQPMMVVGEHVTPFKDNQGSGSEVTQINQGLIDTNNKIAAVPHVSAQAAQPSNPKNGDQWWVLDAQGKATGFKVWNGTAWGDSKIQQSMLNVVSLNAVTITGSTINGSKFTNNFDFTDLGKINFKGVTEITNGSYKTDFKIAGSNQVGHVYVQPDGLHTYMSGLNGDVNTRQSIDLAFDAISLANGSTSGTLTAADIESTDREVWTTQAGEDGDYQVGLSKQFRRVWFDGVLYIPQGQWNGNIGNYNKVLKLSNSKLYPKSNKIIGVTTLGNNSETASIQVQPDGWIVVVWSSRAQRILLEGHFYNLDF